MDAMEPTDTDLTLIQATWIGGHVQADVSMLVTEIRRLRALNAQPVPNGETYYAKCNAELTAHIAKLTLENERLKAAEIVSCAATEELGKARRALDVIAPVTGPVPISERISYLYPGLIDERNTLSEEVTNRDKLTVDLLKTIRELKNTLAKR